MRSSSSKSKLAELEKKQEFNKAINKALKVADRTGSDEALIKLGLGEALIAQLKKPDFAGRRGIPSYVLSNNSSNMRRIRQRIEALRKAADDQTSEQVHGDIRIVDNVEENRVQVFFPGIPAPEVRKKLKQNGFRWSRSAGSVAAPSERCRVVVGAALLRSGVVRHDRILALGSPYRFPGAFFRALEHPRLSTIPFQRSQPGPDAATASLDRFPKTASSVRRSTSLAHDFPPERTIFRPTSPLLIPIN